MKHFRFAILALVLLALGIQADAQYVGAQVQYVKVKSGQWDNFLELEKGIVKYHQARVEKEIILSWSLYRKKFSGSDEGYDFIWVHQYDDFKKTENANPWDLITSIYTQEEIDATMKAIGETREVLRTEHYDAVVFSDGNERSKYIRLNFYKVKGSDTRDYLKIRKEYVKPVFEQLIKDGHVTSWGLWKKWPYSKDYQYVSVDGFSEYGQWKDGLPFKKAFDKVKPGEDFDEVGEDMMRTRTLVKQEIWELVESTEPAGGE